jgi:hypothetical protein
MGFGDFLSNVFDPGDIFGYRGNKSVGAANAALDEAYGKAEEAANKNAGLYQQYMNKVNNAYGGEAGKLGDRVQALEELTPYDAGQFSYDKDVNDFYSKAANQRVNKATNAITNSMANAGNMFSSDYTDALAAKQQALASEEWDKAFDRYQQDRSRALNEFSTNANIGQQTYSNMYNKNKDLLGISQNAQDNTLNAFGSYVQGLANNNSMLAQNAAQIAQAKAANKLSQNKSLLGKIFGSFVFGILSLGPVLTNMF